MDPCTTICGVRAGAVALWDGSVAFWFCITPRLEPLSCADQGVCGISGVISGPLSGCNIVGRRMQSIILLLLINQTKAKMRRHKRHKRPMPYAVRLSAVAFELR